MDKNFKNMFKDYLSSTKNLEAINNKIVKKESNIKMVCFLGLTMIMFFILFSFFDSNNKENISLKDKENGEIIIKIPSEIDKNCYDTLINIEDSKALFKASDYAAIIWVNKIEGVTNYKESVKKPYGNPYTYGKGIVLYTLKGNIEEKEIKFIRDGGKMPYLEWLKGDVDPDKLLNLAFQSGLTMEELEKRIVDTRKYGDIEIEEGKLYLVFMENNKGLIKKDYNYSIWAHEYGLREVNFVSFLFGKNKLKVKDNKLNKYVYLKDILPIINK